VGFVWSGLAVNGYEFPEIARFANPLSSLQIGQNIATGLSSSRTGGFANGSEHIHVEGGEAGVDPAS
jgi:hypothetical protein